METIISPVNSKQYATIPWLDREHALEIVSQSNVAYEKWSQVSIKDRIKILERFMQEFVAMKDEICQELSWLIGRPQKYNYNEIKGFEERARYLISAAEEALAPFQPPEKPNFTRRIEKVPLGVVLVIAPWNYPYLTSVNSIVPALLAGNCVLLKHAPQTFPCADIFFKAFEMAGLPKGVFQVMHMDHSVAASVISNPMIKHVQFTGSVNGGMQVQKTASCNLTGIGMELGGKDAAYVRSDADLDSAAENIVDGALYNSGQSCCAVERVYVDSVVYDDFVNKVVKVASGWKVGDPFDETVHLGPVVKQSSADFIRSQVKDAVKKGARVLVGQVEDEKLMSQGNTPYVAPQVLVDVDHTMNIMTMETFGPLLGIMKVSSDEEAIKLINDSEFGLTASIWSKDMEVAQAIGDEFVYFVKNFQ